MPVEPPSEEWLAEVDAVHLQVREAFRRRDLAAYMDRIASDLVFRKTNGAVWTRSGSSWRLREVRIDREKIERIGFGLV